MPAAPRATTRWQRYWFADGGRLGLAIVRVAVACAVLGCLAHLSMPGSAGDLPGETTLYRPVGIWMLLGHTPPPAIVVSALWIAAWTATAAMLIGLVTRPAIAVSALAGSALAALSFASSRTWSHQYNVVFLAALALLGARAGDTLSIDALIRRVRRLPPVDRARAYQWSLRLVQLAVALMFAGAAFHKILHGHFTLRWALSDNLRHQLLVRYDLVGLSRPVVASWLIDNVWAYRGAALANLVSQTMPLVACFCVRRPWLRAACGSFFVAEVIALGLVVDLWNPWWLPLAAVFVDWDALIAWVARRPVVVPDVAAGWRPSRGVSAFVAVFVAYDIVTAFVPALDQRLNTYPFSGFPMFANVRASAPYSEHQPYDTEAGHFEVTSDLPVVPYQQKWFDHTNRGIETVRDPAQLQRRLAAVIAQANHRYPGLGVHGVRLWLTIYEAPAYPAPAHFDAHPIAIVGEYHDDGRFTTRLGAAPADARLEMIVDDHWAAPQPVAAGDDDGRVLTIAVVHDEPWLVATRGAIP